MSGGFNPIDPQRCAHYAGFAAHLNRKAFDFIYWFLFAAVICMLFLASWKYSGDLDKINQLGLEPHSREYRRRMKRCMIICGLYASVAVVAVVMEVYALMALQFCDGEDLMSLYWSTWTMLQVGSVIAILGIVLSVFNTLRNNKNPPWALALGTPVLVVAGIGHAVHGAMRKRVRQVRSRSRSRRRTMSAASSMTDITARLPTSQRRATSEMTGFPISREQTIRADDSEREPEFAHSCYPNSIYTTKSRENLTIAPVTTTATLTTSAPATFLGFSPTGDPIVKLPADMALLNSAPATPAPGQVTQDPLATMENPAGQQSQDQTRAPTPIQTQQIQVQDHQPPVTPGSVPPAAAAITPGVGIGVNVGSSSTAGTVIGRCSCDEGGVIVALRRPSPTPFQGPAVVRPSGSAAGTVCSTPGPSGPGVTPPGTSLGGNGNGSGNGNGGVLAPVPIRVTRTDGLGTSVGGVVGNGAGGGIRPGNTVRSNSYPVPGQAQSQSQGQGDTAEQQPQPQPHQSQPIRPIPVLPLQLQLQLPCRCPSPVPLTDPASNTGTGTAGPSTSTTFFTPGDVSPRYMGSPVGSRSATPAPGATSPSQLWLNRSPVVRIATPPAVNKEEV